MMVTLTIGNLSQVDGSSRSGSRMHSDWGKSGYFVPKIKLVTGKRARAGDLKPVTA